MATVHPMPAINLSHLRENSIQLVGLFKHPDEFVRRLHNVLSRYSDRTHRPGHAGRPAPLLESYNVPKPVLRQLLLDIKPVAEGDPLPAFQLCDALWEERYFEMRYLGASILGMIDPRPADPVLKRVNHWSRETSEVQLIEVLFEKGLDRLRNEAPEVLIQQIDRWLTDNSISEKRLGLLALIPLIRSASYENLPIFFEQISPIARELNPLLHIETRDVLKELAIKSPVETAFFLRQLITQSSSKDAALLARQNLKNFPPDIRVSLQDLVKISKPEK